MEVLILTLFVSSVLAGAGVGLFVWSIRQGTHEHADRLALLPIEGDRHGEEDANENEEEAPSPPEARRARTQE